MCISDKCIRGIQNCNCLLDDNKNAYLTLFEFRRNICRNDGWNEASINWMDDHDAIDFTLSQTNDDGLLKFPIGIAFLPLTELKKVKKRHPLFFHYERASQEDNHYHGNLLLRADIKKERQNIIRSHLAIISEVHLRENNTSM